MPRKVIKYELTKSPQTIKVPPNAKILGVTPISGKTVIHIEGDAKPTEPPVERTFSVFGPGHPIMNDKAEFVGVATWENGAAWYVYEDVNLARQLPAPPAPAKKSNPLGRAEKKTTAKKTKNEAS